MRTHVRPLALTFALAACGPAPTTPGADLPALARAAAPQRPLTGSCELTFSPAPPQPGTPAPPPGVIRQIDVGTCQLSHLGRTAYSGLLEIDLASGTQRGTRTLTAANGDQLFMTAVGTSAPLGPTRRSFDATLTIVGGTGRFAGATGQAHATGTADLAAARTSVTFEGWIAY